MSAVHTTLIYVLAAFARVLVYASEHLTLEDGGYFETTRTGPQASRPRRRNPPQEQQHACPHAPQGVRRSFVKDYRSDATLGTVLRKEGKESLHQLLKPKR
jgi:hypothetical protein